MNITENNRPLISIIVINFNTKLLYLKRCIDSIEKQTYKNWELIIVDGGSNLTYINYLKKLCKINNKIKLFQGKKGHVIQRILGINNSKGEYIAFIDSDDYVAENYIEILLNNILKGYDVVSSNTCARQNSTNSISPANYNMNYNSNNFFSSIINKSNVIINVFKLYRKDLFKSVKSSKITYGDDLYLNYQIALNNSCIKHYYAVNAKYFYTPSEDNLVANKYLNRSGMKLFRFLYKTYKKSNDINIIIFLKWNVFYFMKVNHSKIMLWKLKKYRNIILKTFYNSLSSDERNALK